MSGRGWSLAAVRFGRHGGEVVVGVDHIIDTGTASWRFRLGLTPKKP
jgi:hypothetical protein